MNKADALQFLEWLDYKGWFVAEWVNGVIGDPFPLDQYTHEQLADLFAVEVPPNPYAGGGLSAAYELVVQESDQWRDLALALLTEDQKSVLLAMYFQLVDNQGWIPASYIADTLVARCVQESRSDLWELYRVLQALPTMLLEGHKATYGSVVRYRLTALGRDVAAALQGEGDE